VASRTPSAGSSGGRSLRRFGLLAGAIGAVAALRHRTIGAHEERRPHVVDRRVPMPGTAAANGHAPSKPGQGQAGSAGR
jgi:hypothetical protein